MHNFTRSGNSYEVLKSKTFKIIPITDIRPQFRAPGVPDFKERKMRSILKAIRKQNPLPPIIVDVIDDPHYTYCIYNGFDRFYASVAAGYSEIPVTIRDWI